jgi:hypothetical protein
LLDLVGRIYEAALQPEAWSDVLTRAADQLRATSGSLILQEGTLAPETAGAGAAVVPQVFVARLDPGTLETVRSQLKSVFQKTETRRQAELVAIITRLSFQPTER